jgi:integral membrane protein
VAVSALRSLRVHAFLEGTSLLCLVFIAMPLKHLFGLPSAVRIVGSVHGLLFLLFVTALFRAASERAWSRQQTLWTLASAFVPGGAFLLDRSLKRELLRALD